MIVKKLRKTIYLFNILCLITLIPIFSSSENNVERIQNYQKTYNNNSDVYISTVSLCRAVNAQLPSASTPITGAALLETLSNINTDELNESELSIYDKIMELLKPSDYFYEEDNFAANASIIISGESYINKTYDEEDIHYYDTLFPYKDMLPWNNWIGDFYYGDNAFLQFNVYSEDLMGDKSSISLKSDTIQSFDTNLDSFIFKDFKLNNTNHNFNGEGVIGNDNMAFMFGRNRLNEGRAHTGNLVISDNFRFQEYMKYSFYSNFLSYHMSLTQFGTQGNNPLEASAFSSNGFQQTRVIHRIEFTPITWFGVVLSNGATMFTDNPLDFRNLFPFDFIHNHYNGSGSEIYDINNPNRDEVNNIAALEFDFGPFYNFSAHIQLVSDQYKMMNEDSSNLPNALGSLLSVDYSKVIDKGIFTTYVEFVYTNPFLYLNTKEDMDGNPFYDLDHIFGYTTFTAKELCYGGYPLGPDTIAFATGVSYRVPSLYNIDLDILYSLKGENGIPYISQMDDSNFNVSDPLITSPSGISENSLSFILKGNYYIIDGINIGYKCGYMYQWNKNHIENNTHSAFQNVMSISFNLVKLLSL